MRSIENSRSSQVTNEISTNSAANSEHGIDTNDATSDVRPSIENPSEPHDAVDHANEPLGALESAAPSEKLEREARYTEHPRHLQSQSEHPGQECHDRLHPGDHHDSLPQLEQATPDWYRKQGLQEELAGLQGSRSLDVRTAESQTTHENAGFVENDRNKQHEHHLLPNEHHEKFEACGIEREDRDKLCVTVETSNHLSVIHGKASNSETGEQLYGNGGMWNHEWNQFFQQQTLPSSDQVFAHLDTLTAKYNLSGSAVHAYGSHNTTTTVEKVRDDISRRSVSR